MNAARARLAEWKTSRLTLRLEVSALLRPIGAAEVTKAYVDGLNDPVVHRYLVAARRERQTIASVQAYVAAAVAADDAILFGIFVDDILRGTVRLHDVGAGDATAHLGIAIFDVSVWGRGIAFRAIKTISDATIKQLNIKRIIAGIEVDNAASQRVFSKAGFTMHATRVLPDGQQAQSWVYELPES